MLRLRVSEPGWMPCCFFLLCRVRILFFSFLSHMSNWIVSFPKYQGAQLECRRSYLENSVQNYRPFPSKLGSRRMRSSSRLPPYPQSRVSKTTISLDQSRLSNAEIPQALAAPVLQEVIVAINAMLSIDVLKPFSPLYGCWTQERECIWSGSYGSSSCGISCSTNRSWSNTGKSSTDQKKNGSQGTFVPFSLVFYFICSRWLFSADRWNIATRPRGRATPAMQQRGSRPIHIWISQINSLPHEVELRYAYRTYAPISSFSAANIIYSIKPRSTFIRRILQPELNFRKHDNDLQTTFEVLFFQAKYRVRFSWGFDSWIHQTHVAQSNRSDFRNSRPSNN